MGPISPLERLVAMTTYDKLCGPGNFLFWTFIIKWFVNYIVSITNSKIGKSTDEKDIKNRTAEKRR